MSGLVLPGRESRKVRITIDIEAACLAGLVKSGTGQIERVRFENGQWRKASLFVTRLEALGAVIDFSSIRIGDLGEHTPVY